MKKDEVPEEEEEGGGGRQMQRETDSVRKACVHELRSSTFTDGVVGEIHTFPAPRWFAEEVWAYFLEPGPIIITSGVRARHSEFAVPWKNGNVSSTVKVPSSSSSCLLLSQTLRAAHTETSEVKPLS